MPSIGSLTIKLKGDNEDLDGVLEDSESKVKGFGRNLGGIGKKIGGGLALGTAGGIALLGGGIAKLGLDSLATAQDIETATAQMQSALGVTEDVAKQLASTGVEVFENNFGESIGEASAAVALTAQQLKNIEFAELGAATQNAYRLADAFDTDLQSSLNAANVLMTQFGLNQQESFDFLSAGFQRGLDSSGDFLDSISEYGNLFGQSGASAGEFFSVLETGLQGGVLGTDKAADLFKEFSIRIQEQTQSQAEALAALGIDGGAMFAGMADGSISVIEAFSQVQTALAQVTDPIQQQALGVELMGTQFEDMGARAVSAIDTASTSLSDLEGSTATLDAQYDTLSAKFETLSRSMQTSLAPIGEVLVEGLTAALPHVENLVNFLVETGVPAIMEAFSAMQTGFAFFEENETFSRIADSFVRIGEALGLIPEGSDASSLAIEAFTALLGTMETGVQAGVIVIEGIALGMEAIAAAVESSVEFFGKFSEALNSISMPPAIQSMIDKFNELKGAIPEWLIPGSPPPLYYALKDIDKAGQALDLQGGFGFDDSPALTSLLNDGLGGDAIATDSPTIINLILDGQLIETIVSGRQGVRRQNRAQLGGATAL